MVPAMPIIFTNLSDMKKLYTIASALTLAVLGGSLTAVAAEQEAARQTITIGDKQYSAVLLEKRDIGPGTVWRRVRVEGYPLNVNLVTMDMTNPYARVETFQGQDAIGRTESIVGAATRLSKSGHKAVAAANGNFWCVSGQEPWSDLLIGTTFGGNMRNSKIITETNNAADQWCGTPLQTCVIGAAPDRLWIEPLVWRGYIAHEKTGYLDFQQVNKVVRDGEIGLYNSWYPAGKQFQPVNQAADANGKQRFSIVDGVSTEVYLKLAEGSDWVVGKEFEAVVTEVRTNAGRGTLGSADICLVGRGQQNAALANLVAGDVVRLYSGWTSFETWETPALENVMQGLALILKDGETDPATNQGNSYNNQVYPKTIYGTDKSNTTLYIMTIDKSTDPVWGVSAGCPSWVACDILKHYGCWRAAAVDAGGSTEMFVTDRIVNKTTESAPRAVANGWMVFNTAPEDNVIARLEFNDVALTAPVYSKPTPRVLGYNQYGTLIDDDVQGITYTCSPEAGECTDDGVYTAAATAGTGTLTAHLGDISVTRPIDIVAADVTLRLHDIVIDHVRKYPVEVHALVEKETFVYHPSLLDWTVEDSSVADIDAEGTLSGIAEGTTSITGVIGDFSDKANVKVQIPQQREIPIAGESAWKTTASSVKNAAVTIGDDGSMTLDFSISSTRAPSVGLTNDIVLFSLPDAIELTINPGACKVTSVVLGIQTPEMSRAQTVTKTVELTADADNKVKFDMHEFGNCDELAFYPVTFKSLKFNLGGSTGAYSIKLPSFCGIYDNYLDGIGNVAVDNSTPAADAPAEYYTLQGLRVPAANLTPGLYIVRRGNTATKIIIR